MRNFTKLFLAPMLLCAASVVNAGAAVNGITAVNEVAEESSVNDQVYAKLSAEVDAIQAQYDLVYSEFVALAQTYGSSWAGQFGNRLSGIQQGINSMKGTLGNAYANGELTEESTLESIYPQYSTITGDLNSLQAQFEQTIMGQVQSIMYDLNMVVNSQMLSAIGNLQNTLNELNLAAQYEERINALYAKKAEAAQKVSGAQAVIFASTNYAERLATAKSIKNDVYVIFAEIQAEVDAINAETLVDQVYAKLSAEIDAILAQYNLVYSEFVALAQINGSGWASSFGNKLGAIQQGINSMKGTLGSLYAQKQLTEESTLESIYPQYSTITGDLNSLQAQFEQTINGQVNSILYDLNMVVNMQMGSLLGNLQNELTSMGVAEQYADRVNALYAKKAEAVQKVADAQAAIGAASTPVDRLTIAKNAKVDIYAMLQEIQDECDAILAEAQLAVGIKSVEYAESFAKGQVYDMNGRRVVAPTKGMFIVNGKKVIIK